MEEDARSRLNERVEECDAVIRVDWDSADPVARRRVSEALREKAAALGALGHFEARVAVWDATIARQAEEPGDLDLLLVDRVLINRAMDLLRSGRPQEAISTLADVRDRHDPPEGDPQRRLVSIRALAVTRDALTALRRYAEAGALDDEIIRRFGDVPEVELQRRVVYALAHRAYLHLREGRVEAALDDGEALLARFRTETDPGTRQQIAEILLDHVKALQAIGETGRWWVASNIGLYIIGALREGGKYLGKRLPFDSAVAGGTLGFGRALRRAPGAASIIGKRRRVEQAIAVCQAVIAQYESAEEAGLRQLVVRARIFEAVALISLGRLGDGFRAFDALTKSGDETVAEAFRALAGTAKSRGGFRGDFESVSFLFHRAATLGQGDSRMSRIAYEESTRSGTRGSPNTRAGTILARLLTPGKPRLRVKR